MAIVFIGLSGKTFLLQQPGLFCQPLEHFFIDSIRSAGQALASNPDNGYLPVQAGLFLPEHLPHPAFHPVAQHSMSQPFAHSRTQLVLPIVRRKYIKDPIFIHAGPAFFVDLLEPFMGLHPIGLGIRIFSGNVLFQSSAPAL